MVSCSTKIKNLLAFLSIFPLYHFFQKLCQASPVENLSRAIARRNPALYTRNCSFMNCRLILGFIQFGDSSDELRGRGKFFIVPIKNLFFLWWSGPQIRFLCSNSMASKSRQHIFLENELLPVWLKTKNYRLSSPQDKFPGPGFVKIFAGILLGYPLLFHNKDWFQISGRKFGLVKLAEEYLALAQKFPGQPIR